MRDQQLIDDLYACAAYARKIGTVRGSYGYNGFGRCAMGVIASVTGYRGDVMFPGPPPVRYLRVIAAMAPHADGPYSDAIIHWNDSCISYRSNHAEVVAERFERIAKSLEDVDRVVQSLTVTPVPQPAVAGKPVSKTAVRKSWWHFAFAGSGDEKHGA